MMHLQLVCTALACMLMNELVGDACMEWHQVHRDTECTTMKPMHTRGTKMQPDPLTKRNVIRNSPPPRNPISKLHT